MLPSQNIWTLRQKENKLQVREKRWVKIVRREAELCYDGSKFKVQALKTNKFKFYPPHSKTNSRFWVHNPFGWKGQSLYDFLTSGKEKMDVLYFSFEVYVL